MKCRETARAYWFLMSHISVVTRPIPIYLPQAFNKYDKGCYQPVTYSAPWLSDQSYPATPPQGSVTYLHVRRGLLYYHPQAPVTLVADDHVRIVSHLRDLGRCSMLTVDYHKLYLMLGQVILESENHTGRCHNGLKATP